MLPKLIYCHHHIASKHHNCFLQDKSNLMGSNWSGKKTTTEKQKWKQTKRTHNKRHGEVFIFPLSQINCMQPLNRFLLSFTRGSLLWIIVFGWLCNREFSHTTDCVSHSRTGIGITIVKSINAKQTPGCFCLNNGQIKNVSERLDTPILYSFHKRLVLQKPKAALPEEAGDAFTGGPVKLHRIGN